MHIQVGMNARLFPSNWRPVREEIAFAQEHGFAYLQLPGPEQGLDAARLGDSIETVGELLRAGGVGTVMEMLILLGPDGRTAAGATPLDVLHANLPTIVGLGCERAHWHLARAGEYDAGAVQRIESMMSAQFAAALGLAKRHGFLLAWSIISRGLVCSAASQPLARRWPGCPSWVSFGISTTRRPSSRQIS